MPNGSTVTLFSPPWTTGSRNLIKDAGHLIIVISSTSDAKICHNKNMAVSFLPVGNSWTVPEWNHRKLLRHGSRGHYRHNPLSRHGQRLPWADWKSQSPLWLLIYHTVEANIYLQLSVPVSIVKWSMGLYMCERFTYLHQTIMCLT